MIISMGVEQNRNIEQLMELSIRDLVSQYSELPMNQPPGWPDMNQEAQTQMREVSDWSETQFPLIAAGEAMTEDVLGYIEEMTGYIKNLSADGGEYVDYTFLFIKGKAWTAEAMYWQRRAREWLPGSVGQERDINKIRAATEKALKHYLVTEIMAGTRIATAEGDTLQKTIC